MATLALTDHIAAPPERTFHVFTDLRNGAGRVKGITKIEILGNEPLGVGTRFNETRVMFGRPCTETMEISAWAPPRLFALSLTTSGCRFVTDFAFKPEAGGTRVDVTFRVTPVTFFAKLMSPLAGMMLKACRKSVLADVADLKAAAEAPAQTPSPLAA